MCYQTKYSKRFCFKLKTSIIAADTVTVSAKRASLILALSFGLNELIKPSLFYWNSILILKLLLTKLVL